MTAGQLGDKWLLRSAGIRPTRQRLALASLMLRQELGHFTARQVFLLSGSRGLHFSMGTIYNALNDFVRAGLLRRIGIGEMSCYCTQMVPHHHFVDEATGHISDIPDGRPTVSNLPAPPEGMEICGVDVFVRLRARQPSNLLRSEP